MKTFYLGLGAQKSGTTWLLRQLIKSRNFQPGLCKEYHLFDYLHLGNTDARNNAKKRITNFKLGDPTLSYEQKVELFDTFYLDPNNYYDYISHILSMDSSFSCDITPSYAGIEASVLEKIKKEFGLRGIKLKVIFIMREPVSRLESQVRMDLRRGKLIRSLSSDDMSFKISKNLERNGLGVHGNYSSTVEQLDMVFSEDEVFYGFYEELFSLYGINRLSNFFQVPISIFEPLDIVNSSPRPFRYSSQQLEIWRKYFNCQYKFISSRFDFDIEKWHHSLFQDLGNREQVS